MHESEEPKPHSLDPIHRAYREGPTVNSAWLTDKRPLTNLQRLAFIILSAFIGLGGSMFTSAGVADLRDADFIPGLVFILLGVATLYLGLRGLWRVFKDVFFRNRHKSEAENSDS